MATFLLVLWYAAPMVKAVAAYRLWRNQIIRRFPTVWISLVASMLVSATLVSLHRRPRMYASVYAWSTPLLLLLEGFAVVGVFWVVTEHYPLCRRPGTALLTALAMIGGFASWLTRFSAVPQGWAGGWRAALLIERHGTFVMAIVLIAVRLLLPRVRGIPIRPSAARAANILTFHVVACSLGSAFTIATSARYPLVSAYISISAGLVTSALYAICLTRASDYCPEGEPLLGEDVRVQLEYHEMRWDLFRRASLGRLKEIE